MRILLGVDVGGQYRNALDMVARLKFPAPSLTLAHSVDVRFPYASPAFPEEGAFAAEYVRIATEQAESCLKEAHDAACEHDLPSAMVRLTGEPAGALVEYADEADMDLVAVHSQRKGRLGALFMGSTSRGLAIASHRSVLVTKGQGTAQGLVSVVFATDHSLYAEKALDQFLRFAPEGVQSVHVVNATHLSAIEDELAPAFLPHQPTQVQWIEDSARQATDQTVQKFKDAGYLATGEVIDMPVNEAIREAMEKTGAELLVMGAQGHGFVHRLFLGSTALHQTVAEPYSVLLLRH